MKNLINYILIELTIIFKIIPFIFYPIGFLFRDKTNLWANSVMIEDLNYNIFILKTGVKKWQIYSSPWFWFFVFFTTGLDTNKKCCGPLWYMKDKKLKWFSDFYISDPEDINAKYPIAHTIKQKFQLLLLSYGWTGWRNSLWCFNEWFFREGRTDYDKMIVSKCNMRDKTLDRTIMPSTAFKDKDGTDRNNQGPYIKYTFDTERKWECLQEGNKTLNFKTYRGENRFFYGKVKVWKLDKIKKFLIMEFLIGWNPYNGMPTYASRFMFKKIDDFATQDYNKYLEYLKNQN